MQINLNQIVKIKLTPTGRQYLAERHNQVYGRLVASHPYRPVAEDEAGYSRWQLRELFGTFGEFMQHPSSNLPFEPVIEVEE